MADIEIEIDGNIVNAKSGEMLIAVTDREGISVPRFCLERPLVNQYHLLYRCHP